MKKISLLLLIIISIFVITSCKKEEDKNNSGIKYYQDNYAIDKELNLDKSTEQEMKDVVNNAIKNAKQQKEGSLYFNYEWWELKYKYNIDYNFNNGNKYLDLTGTEVRIYTDSINEPVDETNSKEYNMDVTLDGEYAYFHDLKRKVKTDVNELIRLIYVGDRIDELLADNVKYYFDEPDPDILFNNYGFTKDDHFVLDMSGGSGGNSKLRFVFKDNHLVYLVGINSQENGVAELYNYQGTIKVDKDFNTDEYNQFSNLPNKDEFIKK